MAEHNQLTPHFQSMTLATNPTRAASVSTQVAATKLSKLLLLLLVCTVLATTAVAEDRRARVGLLFGAATPEGTAPYWAPFMQGMRELGWVPGQTIDFIERFDEGGKAGLPKLAAELVALGVDVLAVSDYAVPAALAATKSVPIVVIDAYDPIAEGMTSSLSRPGGNLTGVSWQSTETAAKRLELAKELLPGLKRIALLTDHTDAGPVVEAKGFRTAAASLKVALEVFEVGHARDFPAAFAAISRYRPQALMITTNGLMIENLEETLRFTSSIGLPTFSEAVPFAEAGVLLTYGVNISDAYKRAAAQVDRLLKGAQVADLPFEQPGKFDLAINMTTAKALGLRIPESIMVRVTRIIR